MSPVRPRAPRNPSRLRRRVVAALLGWAACLGGMQTAAAALEPCCVWTFPSSAPPPFSASELDTAVAIRAPGAGEAVTLGWAGPGVVEARVQTRRRVVPLGASDGPEAARLVALAVVDVLRPAARVDALAGRGRGLRLGLAGAINHGVTSAGFAVEPTLAVGWRLGAYRGFDLGLGFEVGYGQGRGRVTGQDFVVHLVPVRVGAFAARGRYSLLLATLLRPYRSSGLGGGSGLLGGGSAALDVRLWTQGALAVLGSAGVDLLAGAVDFRVRGASLLETGQVAPFARLGVAWSVL